MSVHEDYPYLVERSRRKLPIFPAILYFTSIIPSLLIGWNFEAFRQAAIRILQGGQAPPAVEQPLTVTPAPPTRNQPALAGNVARANSMDSARLHPAIGQPVVPKPQPAVVKSTTAQPELVDSTLEQRHFTQPPRPVSPSITSYSTPAPEADHLMTLDPSHRHQRYPIKLVDPGSKLQILPLSSLELAYEVRPEDGIIDSRHPGEICFQTTNPARIEISIDITKKDRTAATVCLEFLVTNDDGRSVPLTSESIAGYHRRTMADGRDVQGALAEMYAQRRSLEAIVYSSVPMPYLELESKEAQLVYLQSAIPAAHLRHEGLTNQLQALMELTALIDSLDKAELRFAEISAVE